MFDLCQRFSVDLSRYVGHVDEVDVCDVFRSAAPPVTTRQRVSMDDDFRWPDVFVYAEKAEILKKSHVLR